MGGMSHARRRETGKKIISDTNMYLEVDSIYEDAWLQTNVGDRKGSEFNSSLQWEVFVAGCYVELLLILGGWTSRRWIFLVLESRRFS